MFITQTIYNKLVATFRTTAIITFTHVYMKLLLTYWTVYIITKIHNYSNSKITKISYNVSRHSPEVYGTQWSKFWAIGARRCKLYARAFLLMRASSILLVVKSLLMLSMSTQIQKNKHCILSLVVLNSHRYRVQPMSQLVQYFPSCKLCI